MRKILPWMLVWILLVALLWFLRSGAMVLRESAAPNDPAGGAIAPTETGLIETATALGFLLLGAWITGRIFSQLSLPKVSGFLLFGFLVGPNLAEYLGNRYTPLVTHAQLDHLNLVNAIAISLIAFLAGGEIRMGFLIANGRHVILIVATLVTMGLLGVTGSLVALSPVIPLFNQASMAGTVMVGLIVATIAVAGSPAVVLAMLGETGADGPMARVGLAVVVTMDFCLIVIFTAVVSIGINVLPRPEAVAQDQATVAAVESQATSDPAPQAGEAPLQEPSPSAGDAGAAESGADTPENEEAHTAQPERESPRDLALHLAWHLLGSIAVGAVLGVAMAPLVPRVGGKMPVFVVGLCILVALPSAILGLSALLVALAAGFVLSNLWPEPSHPFFRTMEEVALAVYCVFFSMAGTKLDVAAIVNLWPAALLLVGIRGTVLWLATWTGGRLSGLEDPARRWLWTAMIPQAGVVVALIIGLEQSFGAYPWAEGLISLLLATLAIHEFTGPILMRLGLSRAGELSQ